MEIIKHCLYTGNIDEISTRYHAFSKFKYAKVKDVSHLKWINKDDDSISYDTQVVFFGKTGYGKSSTVNAFFGNYIVETSDVAHCTYECQCLDFEMSRNCYLSLTDFPGIGESEYKDEQYLKMYSDFLISSTAIVYVIRADTRDYSIDKSAYKRLFATLTEQKKVIFALNYCDKIEPINRSYSSTPTREQMYNITQKVDLVRDIFRPINEIIPYSAKTGWNMNKLADAIVKVISDSKEIVWY